jgi:hypothetical protein
MVARRSLTEGLKAVPEADPAIEKEFVYGNKAAATKPADAPAEPEEGKTKRQKPINRVPLTTRVREDFSTALKRASLERQLSGQVPNTLQDILEEMMEPWLRTHGYIQ